MEARKYEPMSNGASYALATLAVEQALVDIGFVPPTLYAGSTLIHIAARIADICRINVAFDASLDPNEWYISWNGRSIGSTGV